MRKNYIDNLRWICVLLLFPYHLFMIYNSFGENFYIKGGGIKETTAFIIVTWPWFMPLLFSIAGISTVYALQKRNMGAFILERVKKLLVPLIAGILLVIPAQTYYAERFHNGYTGGYFFQYVLFFTKQTDLSGYSGGFTPGQLWFIFYLFIISLVSIPFIFLGKKITFNFGAIPLPVMSALFILPLLGALILNISGKSLGEYFAYFMLGYFILSRDDIQRRLEKRWPVFFGIAVIFMFIFILWWYDVFRFSGFFYDIASRFYAWLMILSLIGFGGKYLDKSNKVTAYMSRSSFSVYVFHQTWIIITAYYIFLLTGRAFIQMALILPASLLATFVTYEICRRFFVTRFLFAIKNT